MKEVILFGGGGYIGTVLCNYLLEKGYSVTIVDKFVYNNNHSVIPYLNNKNFTFYFGCMSDDNILNKVLKKGSNIVILAGLVGDPITKKYPEQANINNDIAIRKLIEKCRDKELDKVIFVSTCSNYGMLKHNEIADENFELKPLSLYAKSKVKNEEFILNLKDKVDFNPTILRFATAFGLSPRMRFDLTVSEFTKELYFGNELLVYDPDTWRPYCHVIDFARLINLVLNSDAKKTSFEVFNAGNDVNNFTKRGIVDLILTKIRDGKIKYQEHGNDPRNYRVNFDKVRKILGFETKYNVEYGIVELFNALENRLFDNPYPIQQGNYTLEGF